MEYSILDAPNGDVFSKTVVTELDTGFSLVVFLRDGACLSLRASDRSLPDCLPSPARHQVALAIKLFLSCLQTPCRTLFPERALTTRRALPRLKQNENTMATSCDVRSIDRMCTIALRESRTQSSPQGGAT